MIPKIIHIIWIGDESRRPTKNILSWIENNPSWTVKLWGNDELHNLKWFNIRHIQEMIERKELCGVADLMRLEILYNEGGIYVDADMISNHPLEKWLFECDMFACWENEIARPGLIANGVIAAIKKNEFIGRMIFDLHQITELPSLPAWICTGPKFLTESYHKYQYNKLTIWPSHFFLPEHHSMMEYKGNESNVFARHVWGSTRGIY
ncbi:glycosyltransferase family 32 protein [Buttiauxella gaviniae]|uniref:glycosyltransferase family 32 protein n=1 Tax=Buttiauxella gaviniae TaxID=82990 RepID=UPI003BB6F3FD